jgi:hypothetical protein
MLSSTASQHQPYLAFKASQPIIRWPPSYPPSRPTQPQSLASNKGIVVYSTIAPATPFVPPTQQAQHPTIPRTSTDATTTAIIRRHDEKIREWNEHNTVQRALKKQLATAVDKIYLEAHYDDNVGYENISIRTLIQYLFDKYGDMTPLDLRANAKHLNEEWDPNQPIQTLFSQIKIQT